MRGTQGYCERGEWCKMLHTSDATTLDCFHIHVAGARHSSARGRATDVRRAACLRRTPVHTTCVRLVRHLHAAVPSRPFDSPAQHSPTGQRGAPRGVVTLSTHSLVSTQRAFPVGAERLGRGGVRHIDFGRYKTVLCTSFMDDGKCSYGAPALLG
jgi:hypothetical protein